MYGIGFIEQLIIALIGLLLFGNRLPKVMQDLGRAISEFRRGIHGDKP